MKRASKKPRDRKALVRAFLFSSLLLTIAAVLVLGRLVAFTGDDDLVPLIVALLLAGSFFGVLALFASRWKGRVYAKADKEGVEVDMGSSMRSRETGTP